MLTVCLFNQLEGKEHLFVSCMSRKLPCHLKWFRHYGIHMQCGLSVPELQKSFGWSLDLQRLRPCHREGGLFMGSGSVWHLSNLFRIFWRAQDLPSRSRQIILPALEKVRKCLGDQDCRRTRLQDALQSKAVLPYCQRFLCQRQSTRHKSSSVQILLISFQVCFSKMNKWSQLLLYL